MIDEAEPKDPALRAAWVADGPGPAPQGSP